MTTADTKKAPKNFREFERLNEDVGRAESLKIPLSKIRVKPGFNPRNMGKQTTRDKIEGIKESFKAGRYVRPIEVSFAGDFVEIIDGECRWTAATEADQELRDAGQPGIPFMVCVPISKADDKDRLIMTVHGNEGERLNQVEVAEVVKRLINMKLTREQVAKELGYSIGWVDRLIVLSTVSQKYKNLIAEGRIAMDVVVKAYQQYGSHEADGKLEELILTVPEGEKVTNKHAKKAKTEGGGDGDGESEGGKAKTAKEPTKKTISIGQYKTVTELANKAPDFGLKKSEIRMTADYEVTLNGRTLKALIELVEHFKEPEEEQPKE